MKIPKTFVPEKDLEKKVESLKSGVNHSVSLKYLILDPEFFEGLMHCYKVEDPSLEKSYSVLNISEIEEFASLECCPKNANRLYTVYVNIIQFKDKSALENDFPNIIKKVKHLDLIAHVTPLFKDKYAIFVYMFAGDIFFKEKVIDVYKLEFGFKEVKVC